MRRFSCVTKSIPQVVYEFVDLPSSFRDFTSSHHIIHLKEARFLEKQYQHETA